MKQRLSLVSIDNRIIAANQIQEQIIASEIYQSATTILAYASLPSELDLDPFITQALSDNKCICVPQIDWDSKSMQPARISNLDTDLDIGRYDVRAPTQACPLVDRKNIDLILVPGLAFDQNGHRLGRGAGFYDRFIDSLPNTNRPPLVGVCFGCQIVPKVPTESHDHPMDFVLSEHGFLDLKAQCSSKDRGNTDEPA